MLARRLLSSLALLAAVHGAVVPLASTAFAQGRPQQDLVVRGQQLFEDQQYEESIQTLSAALVRPSNNKAQKTEIYRLLALNYITLNRKEEAEGAVRGLLSIEPSYALPPTESPRFRDFFTAVRAKWEEEGRPGLVKETEAAPAAVSMKHASPSQVEASTQIDLTATLEDPGKRVTLVRMYYRTGSKGKFVEGDANVDGVHVRATIPSSAVSPPLVEYYLQGFDKGGLPIVSRGDAAAPLRVAVPEGSKGWVLPVAIGGGILGAAAIVGGLALAGVFKSASKSPPAPGQQQPNGNSSVTVSVGEQRWGARW
jgi:tetratricopeptide (TPR) repeat protein